ncbi:hypothetical protein [Vibrio gallaecicus]|uniref:Uncharacterized protein n=1 Tax=Vibrio gallaecicus TaxID=552386 RepID=A0ABV4NBC7_9VIBR
MLAHNTGALLDGFKEKTRRIALEQLKSLGVEVEFNTSYSKVDSQKTKEQKGKRV